MNKRRQGVGVTLDFFVKLHIGLIDEISCRDDVPLSPESIITKGGSSQCIFALNCRTTSATV